MLRKLAVFAVVFALGLGLVLWYASRRTRVAPPQTGESTAHENPSSSQFTEVKVEGGTSDARDLQVSVSGPIDHKQRDEKLRDVYHLVAKDSKALGSDAYDLPGFSVTTYEPETGAVRAELTAATARVKLDAKDFKLDEHYPITLNEAVATVRQDLPLVPLVITVPVVEGVIGEQSLRSRELVSIRGVGLVGRGTGLSVDGVRRTLELDHQNHVELTLSTGELAKLDSAGRLVLQRLADREGSKDQQIDITAEHSAELDLSGENAVHVSGDLIVLHGLVPGERSKQNFRPVRAEAHGNVKLTSGREVFSGDDLTVTFSDDGKPVHASLVGHPTVSLPLRAPKELVTGSASTRELLVNADGAGPLEVDLGSARAFEFGGPATVHIPALAATLTGRGSLRGRGDTDQEYSTLDVLGGAVLDTLHTEGIERSLDAHVEAEAMTLASGKDEANRSVARMTAKGVTHSTGKLPDGRDFTLDAQNGIETVRSADDLLVPRADGVALEVRGAKGFKASADVLTDFDAKTLTFVAEGAVHLSNEFGEGDGEKLVALDDGTFQLHGSPAKLTFAEGDAQAEELDYDSRKLEALRRAHAHVLIDRHDATLDAAWVRVERDPPLFAGGKKRVSLDARDAVHAVIIEKHEDALPERFEIRSNELHVRGEEEREKQVAGKWLQADGAVDLRYGALQLLHGVGEHFEVDGNGVGHLEPHSTERVSIDGSLPKEGYAFRMKADRVDFTPSQLDATNPDIEIDGVAMPLSAPSKSDQNRHLRAVAGHMTCDRTSLLFTDSVYLGSLDPRERGWSLDAEQALVTATKPSLLAGKAPSADVLAWGNCVARFGEDIEAHGDSMHISRAENRASVSGSPAFITSKLARWEANRLEWNLETNFVRASRGVIRTKEGDAWRLEYESLEQVEGADETIQVMRDPRITVQRGAGKTRTVEFSRAAWMLFWVDQQEWAQLTGRFYTDDGSSPPPMDPSAEARRRRRRDTPSLFTLLEEKTAFSGLLDELYLEGDVESFSGDDLSRLSRIARADAVYLDYVDGHGWVENADITTPMSILEKQTNEHRHLKLHAKWLRHSADGSFRGDDAVITSCDYDKAHYQIKSGDLRMEPSRTHVGTWDVSIRQNALVFENGFHLPLPRIAFPMKPKNKIESKDLHEKRWNVLSFRNLSIDAREASIGGIRWLSIGSQARFGTFIGAEIDFEPGQWLKWLDQWLSGGRIAVPQGGKLDDPDGGTSLRPKYLNKRGLLLGFENSLHRDGIYDLDMNVDGIIDGGSDRGLVRVADSDRSALRAWFHARGRYFYDKDTWLDVVYSQQTDAGVQSEFFEGEYLHFEERESYLHWRKGDDGTLYSSTLEWRSDDFRTEVLETPSFNLFRGRSEIAHVGESALIYTANTNLAYLSRLNGDPKYEAPFADGLGSRSTARFDTVHRLEMPEALGVANLVATPYVEGHATAWQEGVDPTQSPTRAALVGGVDLATTFWKLYGTNYLHELTPQVTVRGDFADETSGGSPVRFDGTERPLDGTFLDLRLRSRVESLVSRNFFDFELAETHAANTATGEPDGWLPIETNAAWLTQFGRVPVGITHDGRYDPIEGQSVYSRTTLAFRPTDQLDIDTGYNSARKLNGDRLYDALTFGALYRFDADRAVNKWELEGRETISQGGGRLASSAIIRRFGHDFVFELELSFVAGEGSNSLSMNLVPLLAWHPSHTTLLDSWRGND